MSSLARLLARHATLIMALAVAAGVLLPGLASLLRPYVLIASMGTIFLTIVQLDSGRFVAYLRRPWLPLALIAWTLVVLPLAVLALVKSMPIAPWVSAGLVLIAATAPILSVGAYSVFLGTDAELLLTTSIPATALSIITLPLFASAVSVEGVAPMALAWMLFTVVGIAFGGAALARWIAGEARIARNAVWLDATMVLLIIVIGAGVTDGLAATLTTRPALALECFLWAVGLNVLLQGVSALVFLRGTSVLAASAALAGGCRNMALLLGVVLGQVGPELQLLIVMAQIQLFLLPSLMRPVYAYFGVKPSSERYARNA
jgi:bile acid:Na+ symporter, BASS family